MNIIFYFTLLQPGREIQDKIYFRKILCRGSDFLIRDLILSFIDHSRGSAFCAVLLKLDSIGKAYFVLAMPIPLLPCRDNSCTES